MILMCAIGLHDKVRKDKWTPNITSEVITEFEQTHTCRRCGKILHHLHLRWDGEEMIEKCRPRRRLNMEIFQASDIHYAPETLEEVDRCFTFAVSAAMDRSVCAVLSGDLFDHRVDLNSPVVAAILDQVARLAGVMPVLILQGTRSHDVPGSLDVFKTIGGRYPVFVADHIGQVALIIASSNDEIGIMATVGRTFWQPSSSWAFTGDLPENTAALFSCLPAVDKGAVAASVGAENAAAAVGEQVAALLKGWSVSNLAARAAGIPTIVVTHGTVSGCITEHGVPMAGLDHEYGTGALFAAEASAVMVGHIHQHQEWEKDGRRIAYPGSVGRLHFGELTDKGVLFWDVRPAGATTEFVVTPAKRLIQIDFKGPPNMEELREVAKTAEGAHVRVRWSVDEDFKHSIDKEAIHALFQSAATIKLEGHINPIQTQRSPGLNKMHTLPEKLRLWCKLSNSDADPLCERLEALMSKDPEEIISCLL